MARKVPEGKVVNYSYIKPINKKFILKHSIETGNTMSEVLDAFLDSARTGKPLKLKSKTPKYVEQAKKVKERKDKKMKALADKATKATKKTKKKTKARPRTKTQKPQETVATL